MRGYFKLQRVLRASSIMAPVKRWKRCVGSIWFDLIVCVGWGFMDLPRWCGILSWHLSSLHHLLYYRYFRSFMFSYPGYSLAISSFGLMGV